MKVRHILFSLAIVIALLTGCSRDTPQVGEHQHTWIDATCTSPKTCSECNATDGEPLEHTWESIDGVMTCSVCGKVDESAVVETKPLYGVPVKDGEEAVEKYLNIFAQNNIQNRASFLESNGWIYGQAWDYDGSSQFVKVRTDGSDFTVLDDGFALNIHIVDNYIYYMNINGSDYGIYKMKTSGEDKQKISDAFGSMQIVNRQIYYYSDYDYEYEEDENGQIKVLPEYCHLYRCELDGSNVTEIIAKPTFHFYVFEDGILYQDDNDKSSLHVCDLDGSDDIKLNDAYSYMPIYDGQFIYYVCDTGTGGDSVRTIWKVKPDGSENQQVANYQVSNAMVMSYDHIYFVYGDDSDRLYRIDKDGSNLTLITQDTNIAYPQLFGNYIKYTKYTDGYQYIEANYFCEYDGSGKWDFLDMID